MPSRAWRRFAFFRLRAAPAWQHGLSCQPSAPLQSARCFAAAACNGAAQIRATQQMIGILQQQRHAAEAQYRAGTAAYPNVLAIRSLIAAS